MMQYGATALMAAAYTGHDDIVDLLIKAGWSIVRSPLRTARHLLKHQRGEEGGGGCVQGLRALRLVSSTSSDHEDAATGEDGGEFPAVAAAQHTCARLADGVHAAAQRVGRGQPGAIKLDRNIHGRW